MNIITSLTNYAKTALIRAVCPSISIGLPTQEAERIGRLDRAAAYNHIQTAAQKVNNSVIGQVVVPVLMNLTGELVVSNIGAAVPALAIGSLAGKTLANRCEPEQVVDQVDEDGVIEVSTRRSTKWKTIYVGAACLTGLAINLICDPSQSHILEVALPIIGSVIAGRQFRELRGMNTENYTVSCLKGATASTAVRIFRNTLFQGQKCLPLTWVGAGIELGAGVVAGNLDTIRELRETPHIHHAIARGVIVSTYGSIPKFSQDLARKMIQSGFLNQLGIEGFTQATLAKMITSAIESRGNANAVVRSLNEYARVVLNDGAVLSELDTFQASLDPSSPESQATLIEAILNGIYGHDALRKLAHKHVAAQVDSLIHYVVDEIPNWEKKLFFASISDRDDQRSQALRKILLKNFIAYVVVQIMTRRMRNDLQTEDLQAAVPNLARAVCGAYNRVIPAMIQQGAVQGAEWAARIAIVQPIKDSLFTRFLRTLSKVLLIWRGFSTFLNPFKSCSL